jgi:hypothetical protein
MDIDELVKEKRELYNERDLCAELYNLWITKLHDYQDDAEKYEMYMGLIHNMEPYAYTVKEQIRTINRKICEFYGVDSIEKTPHAFECTSKYGYEKPN